MSTDADSPSVENGQPQAGKSADPNQPQASGTADPGSQPAPGSNSIGSVEVPGGTVFQGQTIQIDKMEFNFRGLDQFKSAFQFLRGGAMPQGGQAASIFDLVREAEGASTPPGAESADNGIGQAQHADHLPDTEEEIAKWYCDDLRESERRFVQAVAVFHGAPLHLVTKAAGELYIPVQERRRKENGNDRPRSEDVPRSTSDLLVRTHTQRLAVSGAYRVFWVDVQRNGTSTFGLKVLRFIADEAAGVASLTGNTVLSTLSKWATQGESELTWRAARALGVIWWRLDQNQVRETARAWATSRDARLALSAAGLLDGAYETERTEGNTENYTPALSAVARLLRDWSDEVLNNSDSAVAHLQLVRTIASAYSLIGRKWPEVALDGLDYSLQLAPTQAKRDYVSVTLATFVFVSMSYVTLGWSGLVREVFSRLARHLKRLASERAEIASTSGMANARLRREEGLAALFFVFFFVTVASLSADDTEVVSAYSLEYHLPPRPVIPGTQNRDILLAAILAEGEDQLRDDLTTILSTAIMQARVQPAFDVMRSWAEIVLRQNGDQAEALRSSYLAFVVGIGERVMQWDREPGHLGLRSRMAVFRERVQLWASAGRLSGLGPPAHARASDKASAGESLARFARDVQAQLGA